MFYYVINLQRHCTLTRGSHAHLLLHNASSGRHIQCLRALGILLLAGRAQEWLELRQQPGITAWSAIIASHTAQATFPFIFQII